MDQGWAVREAAEIGRRIAQRRTVLHMSAQQLAARCAELGMPEITRPVLVKLEHGRREAVSTAELAVLAAALDTAPILLLYPVGLADSVEYLPGKTAPPWDAARWWADEAYLAPDLAIGPAYRRSAGSLFRDHQQLLSELPADVTRADYLAAAAGQHGGAKSDGERMLALTVRALRDIRLGIRELGLEPPELSPQLKWLGELEN
jgi:transcriptional regulator with XRE-family HTH domain